MITLTFSGSTQHIYPQLVIGWEYDVATGNTVHQPAAQLPPVVERGYEAGSLRTGTLTYLLGTELDARHCAELHRDCDVVTLANDDPTWQAMSYVATGTVHVALDTQTLTRWTVAVTFQEVQA